MDSQLSRRISSRTVVFALVGASVGFGIGLTASFLWRLIGGLYGRRSTKPDVGDVMKELYSLKLEVSEMRRLLYDAPNRIATEKFANQSSRFVLSDDDDDDVFFDIEDEMASIHGSQYVRPDSDTTDYLSVTSKRSGAQLGPPVPQEVIDELDRLASLALGDCPIISSIPVVGAGGDECRWGSQSFARCLVHKHTYRRSPEFLWRFARAAYLASDDVDVEDTSSTILNDPDVPCEVTSVASSQSLNDQAYNLMNRRQFVEKGLAIARRALALTKLAQKDDQAALDSRSLSEVYKWLAVMIGLASEFVGTQQRINYGVEFKKLIDKAIEIRPQDPHSRYLRGRWCYEVYNLSWIERQLASRLFGTPPTATLEEALAEFEETERIRPDFYAANELYLAKCFISRSEYQLAAMWLNKAKQLVEQHRIPTPHLDTGPVRSEIQELLAKYSEYATE